MAIAYVMHKTPYVFPIIGGRKVEHLEANLKALDISLSKEQIDYLESTIPFDPGFPTTMIVSFGLLSFGGFCSDEGCRVTEPVIVSYLRRLRRWQSNPVSNPSRPN